MGQYIWANHDANKDERPFNTRSMPSWLAAAVGYYSQLTHRQCSDLAFEISRRIDEGETQPSSFIGEDHLIDRLPMWLNLFEDLSKEGKEHNCLLYIG